MDILRVEQHPPHIVGESGMVQNLRQVIDKDSASFGTDPLELLLDRQLEEHARSLEQRISCAGNPLARQETPRGLVQIIARALEGKSRLVADDANAGAGRHEPADRL